MFETVSWTNGVSSYCCAEYGILKHSCFSQEKINYHFKKWWLNLAHFDHTTHDAVISGKWIVKCIGVMNLNDLTTLSSHVKTFASYVICGILASTSKILK